MIPFGEDFAYTDGIISAPSRASVSFSCIRWAPGADQYVKDLIDLFEEYGWDWSYHAFREWQGWSAEHSDDPAVMDPVPTTGRKEVLLKAFEKNGK